MSLPVQVAERAGPSTRKNAPIAVNRTWIMRSILHISGPSSAPSHSTAKIRPIQEVTAPCTANRLLSYGQASELTEEGRPSISRVLVLSYLAGPDCAAADEVLKGGGTVAGRDVPNPGHQS